jgi:2-keto-4-pentenoate hydratase/2-oxohepta-3-ene-1,7-dioic acid hydratase in catechol pathway
VPIPERPVLFIKPSTTIAGPYDDTVVPLGATKLDWEVELGVVIGSVARNVRPDQAMSVIAGFTIVDDITERGWIAESGQLTDGKCADGMTPIGPWLVTQDEVPDHRNLELSLDVDGVRRQVGLASDMIFPIPDLIARITARMTLLPGDIISTGTPWGIGHRCTPPIYLQAGNIVEMRISGLGQQRRLVR